MIKVRVTRGLGGLGAGVAGASGLVALGSGACAAPTQDVNAPEENVATLGSALTAAAGTGTLDLEGVWAANWGGSSPTGYGVFATNSVDEYVRVGETMTFRVPMTYVWSQIHPSTDYPTVDVLKKLQVLVRVLFQRDGQTIGTTGLFVKTYEGDTDIYGMMGLTDSFVVPANTMQLAFELSMVDPTAATPTTVKVPATDLTQVQVFGGQLPLKHVLFDSNGSTFRERVIEGGTPVAGATTFLAYTDWRADTVVDATRLDKTIGEAQSYSRFGTYSGPITGDLQYEISYGVDFDDNGAWQAEAPMPLDAASRLIQQYGRHSYETNIVTPAGAKKMSIYFHVKAFLLVDYTRFGGTITWKKYNQGDRVLIAERWDNLNGVAGTNYDFALEAPSTSTASATASVQP